MVHKLKHFGVGVAMTAVTLVVLAYIVRKFLPSNVQALFSFSA